MKIGELARRSGLAASTIRFYESKGLLKAVSRQTNGYRDYPLEAVAVLSIIANAQQTGFTLDEIRRIIAESQAGQSPCDEVREIVRQRLAELDTRLEQMQRYRDELAETLQTWDARGQAEGHFCGLIEGAHLNTDKPASTPLKRRRK